MRPFLVIVRSPFDNARSMISLNSPFGFGQGAMRTHRGLLLF
jgi:hypothetical protein